MFLLTCVFIVSLSAQAEQTSEQTKGKCDDQRCQTMMKLKRTFIEENFRLGDAVQNKQFWDAYSKLEKSEFEAFQQQQKMKKGARHFQPCPLWITRVFSCYTYFLLSCYALIKSTNLAFMSVT